MVIHSGRLLSSELQSCLAESGLSYLMTMARLRVEPSECALAGITAIRDHPLQVDCDLQQRPSFKPGALGGPPPPVFRHDCCHVLGGYETTAAEDGGLIGFQAGFERLDPDRVFAGLEHGSSDPLEVVRDRFASPARGRSAEYPEFTSVSH